MGKITKPMQAKHKETLSPWLGTFVESATKEPLPLLPKRLASFPSRWPFGRGDLYHWSSLLNRFDTILEHLSSTYQLQDGPQARDFGCELLLNHASKSEFGADKTWTKQELEELGYKSDGDQQLLVAVLKFTRMLLENCGNRSIYASSSHLNALLHTTSLTVLVATLEVSYELAQRYQASVKRIANASRYVSSALLANHYNIELERVQQLSLPFVKTPLIRLSDPTTDSPSSSAKGKEKSQLAQRKQAAITHANDLTAIVAADAASWKGWADVKIPYYPEAAPALAADEKLDSGGSPRPSSPTPLRRSSSSTSTPQRSRTFADASSPITPKTPAGNDAHGGSGENLFELPQSVVVSTTIYDLIKRIPTDMSPATRYEAFNRLRTAKALSGSAEQRQELLAVRLLAITNLAYVHTESNFLDKVLRHDIDETRRFQLIYQLAELIRPSSQSQTSVPLWLQTITLALLDIIAQMQSKSQDVVSALSANVNHGILMYVVRKTVASMKEGGPAEENDQITEVDQYNRKLLALTQSMALHLRVGPEIVSAGLMELLIDILKLRSEIAIRNHSAVLQFLDQIVWHHPSAFTTFFSTNGLDVIADLIIDSVTTARKLESEGKGTPTELRSSAVDYSVPYYQQQTIKGLLKFVHHMMTSPGSINGNTDRLLRNLVDKQDFLKSLKTIMDDKKEFGSVVWTHSVTLLGDLINNDPTSYAAISEAGLIKTYLEVVTNQPLPESAASQAAANGEEADVEAQSGDNAPDVEDERSHPPSSETLDQTQRSDLAGGILPSGDAIAIVPQILNSISLNNSGMRLVIASRAFDSYLEIFESPAHIKCLQSGIDHDDLAAHVGGSFDELARHHPRLRKVISNAVIDMVARVRHLGIKNAETLGWGLRIQSDQGEKAPKGENMNDADTSDVQMSDAPSQPATSGHKEKTENTAEDMTLYVLAVGNFLSAYFANSQLKESFIDAGGVELLLDLISSPGLDWRFAGSYAGKMMNQVISMLIEQSPARGIFQVFHRAQAALDTLQPLATRPDDSPAKFSSLIKGNTKVQADTSEQDKLMIKALMDSQQWLKILAEAFVAGRHQTLHLPSVNVYDLYVRLIVSLGSVTRSVFAEEIAELREVPDHWNPAHQSKSEADKANDSGDADGTSRPPSTTPAASSAAQDTSKASSPVRITPQEEATPAFRNFKMLQALQALFSTSAHPLLHSLGKALLNRRDPAISTDDGYARAQQIGILKAMANAFLPNTLTTIEREVTVEKLQYLLNALTAINQMLFDRGPARDRSSPMLSMPVLLALKEQNGLELLNKMMVTFSAHAKAEDDAEGDEKSTISIRGLRQVLDIYHTLANAKLVSEACNASSLQWPRERSQSNLASQFVIELRTIILPAVAELWDSTSMNKLNESLVRRVIETLKTVLQGDQEGTHSTPPELFTLLNGADVRFKWTSTRRQAVENLHKEGFPQDLALEAVFRAFGNTDMARSYCADHVKGIAGPRAAVPAADLEDFHATPTTPGSSDTPAAPEVQPDSINVSGSAHQPPQMTGGLQDILNRIRDAEYNGEPPASRSAQDETNEHSTPTALTKLKSALDESRSAHREHLVDRCLDIVRLHPAVVPEISDLVQVVMSGQFKSGNEGANSFEDVGSTLASALSSLALDEDEQNKNARCIAAYAHLLAVLLRDQRFLDANQESLRGNMDEYVAYLKTASPSQDSTPPWVPYILLILEVLLCRDARLDEFQWTAPKTLEDTVGPLELRPRELLLDDTQRSGIINHVLELLPRIGKNDVLAVSALRILVILTRDSSLAKVVGEKRNLQRLFLMAKQLSGFGSDRMKRTKVSSHLLVILRHIIEDDDTIKQAMREEILATYPAIRQGGNRREVDTKELVRTMHATVLRAPKIFAEVMSQLFTCQWTATAPDASRTHHLVLKDADAKPTDPQPEASEGVKPSTEAIDQDMGDAPRTTESKRPTLDNPDGVVHFLLCELLTYRDVEDPPVSNPDVKTETPAEQAPDSSPSNPSAAAAADTASSRDKASIRPPFKAEDNPLFIYRCLILGCLTELVQNYNKAKIEFINFKRSAHPLSTTTPVKPRSTVLNYLIYDLLCHGNLSGTADSIDHKKRAATAIHTQKLLVGLVSKTRETPRKVANKFELDDDSDLLFVRKFVLDIVLKAYEKTPSSDGSMEVRYARLQSLAELMNQMIGETSSRGGWNPQRLSQMQLRRLMYEKGYLDKLTSSIAEINLKFPGVKRAIKYVLRVLQTLTDTAKKLSQANILPTDNQGEGSDDDFDSSSSLSSLDDDREDTPDLYRNSALGMLEPRGEDDDSDSEGDEEDEEMYGDEYDEEMDYDETMDDAEDNISDEDEDLTNMGEIEGLHGEPGVVEVIMDDDEHDHSTSGESDEDDDADSEDMDDIEDDVEILDEEGNPLDDDGGSPWDDESDGEEEEDEDEDVEEEDLDDEGEILDIAEAPNLPNVESFGDFTRAILGEAHPPQEAWDDYDDYNEEDYPEDEEDEEDVEDLEDQYIYQEEGASADNQDQLPIISSLDGDGVGSGLDRRQRRRLETVTRMLSMMPRHNMGHGGRSRDLGDFDLRNLLSRSAVGLSRHPARPHGMMPHAPPADEDINPLLRRDNADADSTTQRRGPTFASLGSQPWHGPSDAAFLELAQSIPPPFRRGDMAFQLRFRGPMPGSAIMTERDISWMPRPRGESRRESGEPQHATAFASESTKSRYEEEARMIFGQMAPVEASKIVSVILVQLLPAAMEAAREARAAQAEQRKKAEEERQKLEEERRAKLQKEAEEAAARQKQEDEERQAREAAARQEAAMAAPEQDATPQGQGASPMEGVEATGNAATGTQSGSSASQAPANDPRVVTMINGEEVDVTELGIDPEYLAALPEEFRREVIAQAVSSRRSQARDDTTAGESVEEFREFLDALPDDLRLEIEQQERQDQRRRNREESRRQATPATTQDALVATDMDAGSILMTFPPALREQVLMEQGSEILDQLPPELASQARSMMETHRRHPAHSNTAAPVPRDAAATGQSDATNANDNKNASKPVRRSVVQMLDKAGVATLLRLMFIAQQGSIRVHLFNVLADVCENRQNRLEVISTVLQILQEGSVDVYAVERSFGHLSLKARKQKEKDLEQRTPQGLKRTLTSLNVSASSDTNSETSPLLIVQQCLDLLVELANKSQHVSFLFISEHEVVGSTLKRALSRKGKGKDKDTKAHKFAINSLLALLDRDLVIDSSVVMSHLADLLSRVTSTLQLWDRRRKEAANSKAAQAVKTKASEKDGSQQVKPEDADASQNVDTRNEDTAPGTTNQEGAEDNKEDKQVSKREFQGMPAPFIPEHYLTLVVRIFVARECSSKTFQNTIATIKNLSLIDGNKAIFGQELVSQARILSQNIVNDLDELLPQIEKATSGTEVQGVALSKFSPGASEQNKLLRVLTALDHLFDAKKDNKNEEGEGESSNQEQQREKDDFLALLYQNESFATMWTKLSACLKAIHERENMLNVATILLPLIESLMVVCKNTSSSDDLGDGDKDLVLASPQPESGAAGLFFTFTEEHRRILNELVRNNPKLMSGTFSLLVKNPKVLEFDNKRNFFNRSVHSRNAPQHNRANYPTLQLSVRREHVFLDSFKHLYFKSGDEMKYGKLNIRFNGEEGVDAGGVSREWFQVMARQMFDPNYALFTPVSSDRTTFHPNSLSGINDEHLMFFKFIGRIIGKALYEGRVLDCYFSRAVYKRILGKSVSVKDMESFDPDYYKSLCWMLENDITDTIIETFSVEDDAFGVTTTVDLIPDGRNIPVTEQNKSDYVRLVVEHKLLSSVKDQMENFLKGFHEIIPAELISIFNEQELELLISGLPDIDVDDWKSNTEYQNYNPSSPQIQWFWRAVRSFDKEERAKLLQFVTGTSKVPLNGFKELEGMNGVSRFNIHRAYGDKDRLPTSHTCFNQLDIPEYESYDALRSQFMKAITAGSEYFGFA